jgi:hypothetical protein
MTLYGAALTFWALVALYCTLDIIRLRRNAQKAIKAHEAEMAEIRADTLLIWDAACQEYVRARGQNWYVEVDQKRMH